MKITINKSSIENSGKKIIENVELFSSDIKKLIDVIDNINNVWEGADALKHINTMKNIYVNELTELSNTLNSYGEYLKNIPGAYEILDETFSNKNINV